jgi:hypothetical protein
MSVAGQIPANGETEQVRTDLVLTGIGVGLLVKNACPVSLLPAAFSLDQVQIPTDLHDYI